MMKTIMNTLTLASMLTNSGFVFADGDGNRGGAPSSKCDKKLVREIYKDGTAELMDAHKKYFVEKETHDMSVDEFCDWLRRRKLGIDKQDGGTEARFGECDGTCGKPEPGNPEVDRSIPRDVRQRMRDVARSERVVVREEREEGPRESGGGFMSSPFMGGLLGGALGGFLGGMLAGRMGQQQQQPYFPQPFGQYGMQGPPGALPIPGGAPGMLPIPGQMGGQFGGNPYALPMQNGVQPWAAPYLAGQQQFAGIGYGGGAYQGYNQYAGGYRGVGPGVLPLAPQSNFGVGGSIPQNHWNLINVGR